MRDWHIGWPYKMPRQWWGLQTHRNITEWIAVGERMLTRLQLSLLETAVQGRWISRIISFDKSQSVHSKWPEVATPAVRVRWTLYVAASEWSRSSHINSNWEQAKVVVTLLRPHQGKLLAVGTGWCLLNVSCVSVWGTQKSFGVGPWWQQGQERMEWIKV